MKKLVLLMLLIVNLSVNAEPSPFLYLKIQIQFSNGEMKTFGLQTSSETTNLDSLHYSAYLAKEIPAIADYQDSLTLYADWVEFECEDYWSLEKNTMEVIGLFNPQKVYVGDVESYKLIAVKKYGPGVGIYNPLNSDDQEWMRGKPLEVIRTNAEICDFMVNIFEKTVETDKFSRELKAINKSDLNFSQKAERVYELLNSIGEKKIVVVNYCSC